MVRKRKAGPSRSLAELHYVQWQSGRILDDSSIELIAALRERGVLSDTEWAKTVEELRWALAFLSEPNRTSYVNGARLLVFDPDADPRNADWLKISAAARMCGHWLPIWSALWLWRLWMDGSPAKWREVNKVAARFDYQTREQRDIDET